MARTTIVAIEKGERSINADELVSIAALYSRPVNELLRRVRVPTDFVAQFRLAPTPTIDDKQARSAVELLQRLADDYVELERIAQAPLPLRYPAEANIAGLDPEGSGRVSCDQRAEQAGPGRRTRPTAPTDARNGRQLIFSIQLPSPGCRVVRQLR